jgi:hypothetical protein
MTYAVSEIKTQEAIQNVEKAFVANLHGHDILFIKTVGNNPIAYRLPENFLDRLEASKKPKGLFPLGKTYLTPGAIEALQKAEQSANEFLAMHQSGNWGIVDELDWHENDCSVSQSFRILSAYKTKKDVKLWVITEADMSSTTVLLPEEY